MTILFIILAVVVYEVAVLSVAVKPTVSVLATEARFAVTTVVVVVTIVRKCKIIHTMGVLMSLSLTG